MSRRGRQTPREALFDNRGTKVIPVDEGQVVGRSTLEEAKSSRENETVNASFRWTAVGEKPQGTAETSEAEVGAGNPMYPVIRSHTKLRGASNLHERQRWTGQPGWRSGQRS